MNGRKPVQTAVILCIFIFVNKPLLQRFAISAITAAEAGKMFYFYCRI